jgi:hypothetical protein
MPAALSQSPDPILRVQRSFTVNQFTVSAGEKK